MGLILIRIEVHMLARNLNLSLSRIMPLFLMLSLVLLPLMSFADHSRPKKESQTKKLPYQLAIGAIFRDEASYLKEWIEYHLLVGVDHFYLYNNLSSDDYKQVLEPYIKKGLVELTNWSFAYERISRWSPIQCSAYSEILQKASGKAKWLAIIDIDEFIVPLKEDNLRTALAEYENYGALGVNWQMFGTANVQKIPANRHLIETLLLKGPVDYTDNIHVKCIVRPERTSSCESPHYCHLQRGYVQVNTNKEIFMGPFSPYVASDKIVINHYWTRDIDYLKQKKIARRNAWQEGEEGVMQRANQLNQVEDRAIVRFAPQLRKKIFLNT